MVHGHVRHGLLYITLGYYIQPDFIAFSQHPDSQMVLEQSPVVLQCALNLISLNQELPPPDIEWQFNDEPASCAVDSSDHNSSLVSTCTIETALAHDSGWYRCLVVDGNTGSHDGRKFCEELGCIETRTASQPAYVHVICKFLVPLRFLTA